MSQQTLEKHRFAKNSSGKSFLFTALAVALGFAAQVNAGPAQPKPVIADIRMLEAAGVELLTADQELGLGYAVITEDQEMRMSELAHQERKCGGFEMLPFGAVDANHPLIHDVFGQIREQNAKNRRFRPRSEMFAEVEARAEITSALEEVSASNIRSTVEFLSSFPHRHHRNDEPNQAIEALKVRIEELTRTSSLPVTVELVSHQRIEQKSIRVRITGAQRPNEIVVLGGHIDSINSSGGNAPGADDNASGSGGLLEALRVILSKKQPERTVEFYWYAGEEGGLIGSSEIASKYKEQRAQVVGVLQLDMTLFPGSGAFTLGSMTDYTSAWLRSYLETINGLYVKARIENSRCGYGCSDHASWYRNGYPAIMPFEAAMGGRNRKIHTDEDVIDSNSNFEHAAVFSKIAVVMAMDLANSTLREGQ